MVGAGVLGRGHGGDTGCGRPHCAPDTATFHILTAALCRAGQPSATVDLLRCMPPLLLDPDPCHCRVVLASLCCRGAPAARRGEARGEAGGRAARSRRFAAGERIEEGGQIVAVAACTELSRAGVAVGGRADLAGHGGRAVAAGFGGWLAGVRLVR